MRPGTTRRLWVAALAVAGLALPARAASPIDTREARRAFDDFRRVCRADAGKLWGESLCGPLLLVDPATRAFVASERPAQPPAPAREGGLYTGVLPAAQTVANTSVEWAGTTWAQLLWPLPQEPTARRVLLVHESFHRVQERLGLADSDSGNAHLDSLEGRVLLQLEWRALQRALAAKGAERSSAVEDALVFRAARRAHFPGSAAQEAALERHEGLAEYTGIRLTGTSTAQRRALAQKNLEEAAHRASFVRGFAYASGPAYGLLLDEVGATWRARMREEPSADLGALLGAALSLQVPEAPEAADVAARGERYGAAALRQAEEAREAEARDQQSQYRRKLVEGPVLRLPLKKMKIEFDPNTLVPLGEAGTVYPTGRILDVWGVLTVTGGVLVDAGWKGAQVAAPAQADALSGDGWTLQLTPGWRTAPGERPGDLQLREP